MTDFEFLSGQIAGLTGLVISLILVLERSNTLDRADLLNEIRQAYDALDPSLREAEIGRFMATMIRSLEAPDDPANPPPRPSWLRGVISGGREPSGK